MKKYLLGFVALIVAATFAYAFTTAEKKDIASKASKVLTIQNYEFTSATNPPASKPDVINTSNWTVRSTAPSCNGLDNLWCSIQFNDVNTTLAQALDILGERVRLGQSINHNTQYTDNAGHFVTIFLRD